MGSILFIKKNITDEKKVILLWFLSTVIIVITNRLLRYLICLDILSIFFGLVKGYLPSENN